MLTALTHHILPVFAMPLLGFILGRMAWISREEAGAVNRIALLVLQPPLVFPLVAGLDLGAFDWAALGLYALCEAVAFVVTVAFARLVLGRAMQEAWLLGMAVVFVNSLLYILSISTSIYGPGGVVPITAVVALDATFWFAFFIISTDLMAHRGKGSAAALRRIATNPILVSILAGAVFVLAGWRLPVPVLNALDFAGRGAAPLTLFALGVILSGTRLWPDRTVTSIAGLKLVVFPLLVWAALDLVAVPVDWEAQMILNAAGPSGAMAFALALLYGVRTDAIAPVIIWTSLLSLGSLAWLA